MKPSAGRRRSPPAPGCRTFALLGFLLRRRDRYVDDPRLARLCGAMRGLLVAYSLFFLLLPALL